MRQTFLVSLLLLASPLSAQDWLQWGSSARHDSTSPVVARDLDLIGAEIVLDPNAETMEQMVGFLPAHYAVPIVAGSDLIVVMKSGPLTNLAARETQTWNVVNLNRNAAGKYVQRWAYESDWKPVPYGSASWEPVYHPAVHGNAVWAPAFGGAIDRIDRASGTLMHRFNPFGTVDPMIFVTGPPAIDGAGNVFYNTVQLSESGPWSVNNPNAWLVRIGADGTITKATFASLTPNAPGANDQCTSVFDSSQLPFPPSSSATAPKIRCGPQRPGINVAPAVAADGTVYTISRAHLIGRWGFLVATNNDLTLKWASSLRNRMTDGCDVGLPPSGSPGGCRAGSRAGVDPTDNEPGSGIVNDNGTSSPVVAPDGSVFYGALTSYNWSQGHLMKFGSDGSFLASYPWGWDLSPAIYQHDGTYSVIIKENHYPGGSYCGNRTYCPSRDQTPWDPESYYITQLSPSLVPEWKYKSTNTLNCERLPNGSLACNDDHPHGFEWCVNSIAVDARGVVYANSEDGNLYAINQGGTMRQRIFLRVAIGAAYTPTSIGPDGRIYTQNDGNLFIIDQYPRSRIVRRK